LFFEPIASVSSLFSSSFAAAAVLLVLLSVASGIVTGKRIPAGVEYLKRKTHKRTWK